MNLFNFLRFSKIESKANDDKVLFRLAQKRNGKFVLVNDKGNIVSVECDWISKQIDGIRLFENNGILYYFTKENGQASGKILPRVSANEKAENQEVYATADENGVTQVFLNQISTRDYNITKDETNDVQSNRETERTFLINSNKEISNLFKMLTAVNKNGLRIAIDANTSNVYIINKDGTEIYQEFSKITSPDENGVRIATSVKEDNDYLNGQETFYRDVYSLLPANFEKTNPFYYDITRFDKDNYKVTHTNGKQEILNKNGKNVSGGKYSEISKPNALGEVIANRSRKNNGIVLYHEGKRYKKFSDPHRVLDASPIGIKAMKYGSGLNQNVVAGVNISEGLQIDEDVNRVLIALLKGEKPANRFWKSIEQNNKFDKLFDGVSSYEAKLDEIASARPDMAEEINQKKQNLSKSLTSILRRKVAGHRTYEKIQDRKIEQKEEEIVAHQQNIDESANAREKLSNAINSFEKGN